MLLIRRNGVWDLPKGKRERSESDAECAVREVEEETGGEGLSITEYLCDTWHEYREQGKRVGKTTVWYLMKEATGKELRYTPQQEEGITELKWFDLSDAYKTVEYANLKNVLEEAGKKLL